MRFKWSVERKPHTQKTASEITEQQKNKTKRKMETQTRESQERRGETQERRGETQERRGQTQERRGQRLVRRESMEKKPNFSCDPDEPVKFDSDDKTEMRFSQTLHHVLKNTQHH